MATRTIDMNVAIMRDDRRIHFRLVCDARASLVGSQTFTIVSPGCETVSVVPNGNRIDNRSDGTTICVAVVLNLDFNTTLARLRKLPNVSNVRVE